MTEREKKLSEVIDFYVKHSIIDIGGETMTLGDAIRELRGGNNTITKWRKCSEQQPETPRNALVVVDGYIKIGYWGGHSWDVDDWRIAEPTHWMNLPLPPKPEDDANDT